MVCAPAIRRRLLWSCGDRFILDVIFGEYLVSRPAETILYSAQLDFCSSVVDALPADGLERVVSVEGRGMEWLTSAAPSVFSATGA